VGVAEAVTAAMLAHGPERLAGGAPTTGTAAGTGTIGAGATGVGITGCGSGRTDVVDVRACTRRTVLPPREVTGVAASCDARAAPLSPVPEMSTVKTTLPALTVALTALAGMPSLVAMSAVMAEIVAEEYWSSVPSSVMLSLPTDRVGMLSVSFWPPWQCPPTLHEKKCRPVAPSGMMKRLGDEEPIN